MKVLNRIMSAFGYVPRSASSLAFDITVNSGSVDAAIEKLGRMQAAAVEAEAAIDSAAAMADFGENDIAAEPARDELLCEVRALIQEIREERRNCIRTARCWGAEVAPVAGELVADETPGLILAELRKQATFLEVLAKQGEEIRRDNILTTRMWSGAMRTSADASGLPG